MDFYRLKFIDRLLSAFMLRDSEIDDLLCTFSIPLKEKQLAKKFLQNKNRIYKIANKYDYRIVSLGYNCLPCTLPTKWGLKPTLVMGEKRLPFDLAVHSTKSIEGLLSNCFNNYHATGVGLKEANNLKFYYYECKQIDAYFNHDNVAVSDNDKIEQLQQQDGFYNEINSKLADRAGKFIRRAQKGNCLFLWCLSGEDKSTEKFDIDKSYLLEVNKHLQNFSDSNKLVVLNFDVEDEGIEEYNGVTTIKIKPSTNTYHHDWFRPSFYFTEEGFEFEQRLVESILDVIKSTFPEKDQGGSVIDESIFSFYKKSASLYYHIGRYYFSLSQFAEAKKSFEYAIHINYNFLDSHFYLSCIYAKDNQVDKAIMEIQTAIELSGDNSGFYRHLGGLFIRKGDVDKAEVAFKKATELDPKIVGAHIQLSRIYADGSKIDKAINEIKLEIEIDGNKAYYHHGLGVLYIKKGDMENAENALKKAIELDPKIMGAHIQLIQIYTNRKQIGKAIDLAHSALKSVEDSSKIQYHLDTLLAMKRNTDRVKNYIY